MREREEGVPTGRTPRDDRFYFGDSATPHTAPEVFAGLTPRVFASAEEPPSRVPATLKNSLPLLMTGSLAAGVGVTSSIPVQASAPQSTPVSGETKIHHAKQSLAELISHAFVPFTHRVVTTVAPHIPDSYRVKKGDTLSGVAEKFGIPTTLLLTLNGLSWNSILHEGQVVKLTPAPSKQKGTPALRPNESKYTVKASAPLSTVAEKLGVSSEALAAVNGRSVSDQLLPGDTLVVPGSRADTTPRVAPASVSGQPRIVWASAESPDGEQEPGEDGDSDGGEGTSTQTGDPGTWDIAEAPELRPKKPVAPPPAPAPPKAAPAPKKEEVQASSTEQATPKPVSGAITPLNDTRRANAKIIVDVGRELGVPDYGIVIALATAMQESSLRNIDWGDRDSVGLFQQRPSSGWGSAEQIMDPVFASKAFYGGPQNPNAGRTRGLLDYSGWQSLSVTVAAQKVQRSAYPEAYAKWEASAWAWLEELS